MAQDADASGNGAPAPELDQDDGTVTSHELARDEQGRFAAREAEKAAEAARTPPAGYVPQEALHAARQQAKEAADEKAAMRRELDELKGYVKGAIPKPPEVVKEVPNWWEKPDDAVKYHLDEFGRPIQERITAAEKAAADLRAEWQRDREESSKERAIDKHGEDAVKEAFNAFSAAHQADPMGLKPTYDRIMASRHMYGELMKWHQERSVLTKVGADPDAYIEAEVKKRLAALQGAAAPQAQGNEDDDAGGEEPPAPAPKAGAKPVKFPSNLAGSRSAGARTTAEWNGPKPLNEIMGGR